MKQKLVDYWYNEDGDLVCLTEDGEKYIMKKPWLESVTFEGLDYSDTEVCTIEQTLRYDTV